jgi:hypothetical protein
MSTQEISLLVNQLVKSTASRRRKPSPRCLKIYEAVRVRNEPQLSVACEHDVSQQRVSAICRQVERWLRQDNPHQPQADEQRRTERWLARRRLEEVHGWSLQGLARSGKTLQTVVTRMTDGGPTVRQITNKDQHLDVIPLPR